MKISSVFTSLDGEVTLGGPLQWAVFVRTGGCNLRCWKSSGYCDTPQALDINHKYKEMSVDEVLKDVLDRGVMRCTITGGEPYLQAKEVRELTGWLHSYGRTVSLETSGSLFMTLYDIEHFDCVISDLKPPSSEMSTHNKLENLKYLRRGDYIKVVVGDLLDLEWLLGTLARYDTVAQIAVGPRMSGGSLPTISIQDLVGWIMKRRLWHWRLNLQLHKYIWPISPRVDLVGRTPEELSPEEYERMERSEV